MSKSKPATRSDINEALRIKRTLGTYIAARYMRKLNWPIGAALALLTGK